MSFITSFLGLDHLFTTYKGTYGCPCGAVQISLSVPPSSHVPVEPTNGLCHCKDCTAFAKACSGGNTILLNSATHLIQLYKSDVTVTKGKEFIGSVKLYGWSPMVRCYCTQCGTPLGADIAPAPVALLHPQLITGGTMPMHFPRVVINHASALEGTRPYCRETSVRSGAAAPWFFFRVFFRVILGLLLGKGKGGFLMNEYASVPVGIDHIQKNEKKSK